jgi:hypothetical protein
VVSDERLGYDPRADYVETHMREWRRAVHARKATQTVDLGFVDARRGEALPPNKDAARAYCNDKYTKVRQLQLAKENHAAIVASSSRPSP